MSDNGKHNQEDALERLMALLALNSQTLPEQVPLMQADPTNLDLEALTVTEKEAFYAYLDSNPDALERYIVHYRMPDSNVHTSESAAESAASEEGLAEASTTNRTPALGKLFPRPVVMSGLIALLMVALIPLLLLRSMSENLLTNSFSQLQHSIEGSGEHLTMPWERGPNSLGFSAPSSEADNFTFAFTLGMIAGLDRISEWSSAGQSLSLDSSPTDFLQSETGQFAQQLGQWNILLSVAASNHKKLPKAFWSKQLTLWKQFEGQGKKVQADPQLMKHLQDVGKSLTKLQSQQSGRAAADLLRELELYREANALQKIQ